MFWERADSGREGGREGWRADRRNEADRRSEAGGRAGGWAGRWTTRLQTESLRSIAVRMRSQWMRSEYVRPIKVLIDELPMVPDELLGIFEHHLADASVDSRYKYWADKSRRLFGGYNMLGFGDFYQIPPIPASASLANPPIGKKSEAALRALNLLWTDGRDSLNLFVELTVQKRIDDRWYATVMEECRYGALSQEAYNFLVGLPTEHAGSWSADGTLHCNSDSCAELPQTWKRMSALGASWADMQCLECSICSAERQRRNRVLDAEDPRVRQEPYLSAPFIHKNNEPKYHAMLLRASEQAKTSRKHTIWFAAIDTPENQPKW